MRIILTFLILAAVTLVGGACSQDKPAMSGKSGADDNFILVTGGALANAKSNYYGAQLNVSDFYIGKYEVTQQEWMEVMGSNPSAFVGAHLPVEMVSWYDAIEYCNKRSIQEGLQPYYNMDKEQIDPNNTSEYDDMKWTVTINEGANGYRLPTEAEWEYAASGGGRSNGYMYSGSDDADEVAWYWRNSGNQHLSGDWNWPAIENNRNKTQPIGSKMGNELGLYDMSGNVREWIWNWYGDEPDSDSGSWRVVKGGGWMGDVSNNEIAFRGKFEANGFGPDQGFRISRSK